jgi:hypothetical protein
MDEKKVFAGTGKIVTSWKRGISICLDDVQNYATRSKNGKFYVNLNVVDLKEPNQWGKDVSVEVNTWKPNQTTGAPQRSYQKPQRGTQQPSYTAQQRPNTPENFVDDSGDLQIPF